MVAGPQRDPETLRRRRRWRRQVVGWAELGRVSILRSEGSDHLYCSGQAARRKSSSGRAIINN